MGVIPHKMLAASHFLQDLEEDGVDPASLELRVEPPKNASAAAPDLRGIKRFYRAELRAEG
jgi:hypothetical protein